MSDGWHLRVDGSRILGPDGSQVVLRGVCLGGWMNMENALTGFPATESLHRQVLRDAMGEAAYERFFERFLDVFFGPEDAALLASLGLNCVRLGINYRHFEDDMRPFELKEEGFRLLDRAIARCASHGLYAIIDLHAAPGFQSPGWHADNPGHRAGFWDHVHFQDRVVSFWETAASRYRDNPWVAGYNILNEPADPHRTRIAPFYARVHDAIRAIDPDHILFFDGNESSLDFDMFDVVWPNTVWSVHDYSVAGFADAGTYPGVSRGAFLDFGVLEATFLKRTSFMRDRGLPLWVGEFGPYCTGDPERDAMRYQLLRDQLEIFTRHGAGWSIWGYKDIGLQGLVFADPHSPYMQRISGVVAKKARLGVDEWGSTDAGIRKVMEPIEQLFDREFPRFGATRDRAWFINRLVRHILLAEPLLDEFADCFKGVTPHEAETLADSFRLGNCVRRDELLDILASAANPTSQQPGGATMAPALQPEATP